MYNEGVKAYFEKFFYEREIIEGYAIEKDEVTLVFGYTTGSGITLASKSKRMNLDETIRFLESTGIVGANNVLSELKKHRK